MSRLRRLPSPALCLAFVAVLLAGAGTSYGERAVSSAVATITGKQIKKRAIKAKHLKTGAVRSRAVKNGTLLAQDFKAGELARGPQGPGGDTGPQGVPGSPGAKGDTGPAGTARAYGYVRVAGTSFELAAGSSKGVVALTTDAGGSSVACIQLEPSIDADTAVVAASPLGPVTDGQAIVHNPPSTWCLGENEIAVSTTDVDTPNGAIFRPFSFIVA